jgi:hypothetical protein
VTQLAEVAANVPQEYIYSGDSGSPVVGWGTVPKLYGILSARSPDYRYGYFITSQWLHTMTPADHYFDSKATTLTATLEFPVQAVQQGQGVCSWMDVTNNNGVPAKNVRIERITNVPNTLNYYTPAGQWNTPYTIGGTQTARLRCV